MKRRIFVNIAIEGQKNVGVIDLGEVNDTKKINLREIVEPKLVLALKEHYSCPVKIVTVESLQLSTTVVLSAHVLIEAEDSDFYEDIKMEEICVY